MTTQSQRIERRIDGDIQDEITALAITTDWTPAQIYREIGERDQSRVSRRTVERIVKENRVKDETGPWLMKETDGEDARLILNVLAGVMTWSKGYRQSITKAEAEWILRISKAAPGLSTRNIWLVAATYRSRDHRGADTTDLDAYLSFMPWLDEEALSRYKSAVKSGWIKATNMWHDLVEAPPPGQAFDMPFEEAYKVDRDGGEDYEEPEITEGRPSGLVE